MVHKFSVQNYGPFRERIEFNFTAGKSHSDDSRFFVSPSGITLSKAIVLFGSNGSGKTKALQAWSFFIWFLLHSYKDIDKDAKITQLDPFRFQDYFYESITEFKCKFEANSTMYNYRLSLNRNKVVYEALTREPSDNTTKWPYLYRWSNINKSLVTLREPFSEYEKLIGDRKNCTVFSTLRAANNTDIASLSKVFEGYDNLGRAGRMDLTGYSSLSDAAESYKDDQALLNDVSQVMHMLGMQMNRIDIKPRKIVRDNTEEQINLPFSIYSIREKEYTLPFVFESDGTKAAFVLLGPILRMLNDGALLVLDELDQDMHPHLVKTIFSILMDECYNISNCQIVCSTHCPEILDKVHRRQVYLVERSSVNMESTMTRLSDIKGLTNKDNLKAKYLAGALGGIPEQY